MGSPNPVIVHKVWFAMDVVNVVMYQRVLEWFSENGHQDFIVESYQEWPRRITYRVDTEKAFEVFLKLVEMGKDGVISKCEFGSFF